MSKEIEKWQRLSDNLEATTTGFGSPYEYISVRTIDPSTKVLVVLGAFHQEYMAYDSSLSVRDAVARFRRLKEHR